MNNLPEEKDFIHELMNILTQVNMRIDMVKKLLDQDSPVLTDIKEQTQKASEASHKLIELARERRESLN